MNPSVNIVWFRIWPLIQGACYLTCVQSSVIGSWIGPPRSLNIILGDPHASMRFTYVSPKLDKPVTLSALWTLLSVVGNNSECLQDEQPSKYYYYWLISAL
jgi:hypothetical protein